MTEARRGEGYQRFETPLQEQRKFGRAFAASASALEPPSSVLAIVRTRQRTDCLAPAGVHERAGRRLSLARRAIRLPPVASPATRAARRSRPLRGRGVVQAVSSPAPLDDLRGADGNPPRSQNGRPADCHRTGGRRFSASAISSRAARACESGKLDAFAAMTDEERPTYEAWLARPQVILGELTARFEPIVIRRRWGKLVFLGRPVTTPQTPVASGFSRTAPAG